jgi:hypothetical protein
LNGIGRLYFDKNFHASKRISIILLINANNGANGKATTNKVTKPN